jgi:filamentous hemagglutinin
MSSTDTTNALHYAPNPKHKEPWQPGRKGSLCPKDITLKRAKELLDASFLHKQQRYAVDSGRAFIGKPDNLGRWHGYPVGWVEVPESLRRKFEKAGLVRNRDFQRHWRRQNDVT